MDGQNATTVLHLDSPQALTIDYLLSHIYYVDISGLHVLSNAKSKLVLKNIQSRAITIFEDWIYVYARDGIQKVNKITGKVLRIQNVGFTLRTHYFYG